MYICIYTHIHVLFLSIKYIKHLSLKFLSENCDLKKELLFRPNNTHISFFCNSNSIPRAHMKISSPCWMYWLESKAFMTFNHSFWKAYEFIQITLFFFYFSSSWKNKTTNLHLLPNCMILLLNIGYVQKADLKYCHIYFP